MRSQRTESHVKFAAYRFGNFGILSLISVFCLLAAIRFPDFPVHDVAAYSISANVPGFAIGIQPVYDLKAQRNYFRAELTARVPTPLLGPLYAGGKAAAIPVFVVVQNTSQDEDFLFEVQKLTYEVSNKKGAVPQLELFNNLRAGSQDLAAINENLLRKALKSKTLSPGGSTHGFLYIPKPISNQKISLHFPVVKISSGETLVLDFIF